MSHSHRSVASLTLASLSLAFLLLAGGCTAEALAATHQEGAPSPSTDVEAVAAPRVLAADGEAEASTEETGSSASGSSASESAASESAASESAAVEPTAPAAADPAVPYDLGTPPAEVDVQWPAPPRITREVTVTTHAQALEAAATSGTRLRVSGAIAGTIDVSASDVDVVFAPGASADAVFIGSRLARVAIHGGTVDHVEMELPTDPTATEYRAEWMTTDVLVDGIEVDADDTAFLMRAGVRIAIVNSRARAARYCVWFGDTGDFESEDVILAGNELESVNPEATVRLVHVVRSATVGNRLTNGGQKHNYRVHGRSDLNWASRNLLVNSGIMLDTMATDSIRRQWFDDNVFHHTEPSLLEIDLDVPQVTMRRNTIYSDVWSCLLCRDTPTGWTIEGTRMMPYQPPPAAR